MHDMNNSLGSTVSRRTSARTREHGGAKGVLLVMIGLAAGLGGGALWHYRSTKLPTAEGEGVPVVRLSDGTKSALQQVSSPLEIRFYATFGGRNVPEALRAFATRTDQLLLAIQQAAGGRITLTRHVSAVDADTRAAVADGIQPLNLDNGEVGHLGVVVVAGPQREVLPQLALEWENALEADLARAIARVAAARRLAAQTEVTTAADAAAAESVQRALPNLASLSLADGERQLREAALQQFREVATTMRTQIEQAQERLSQAMKAGSEAEQQAALAHLRQLQADQIQKLKDISVQLRTHTTALEKLKTAGTSPARVQTHSRTNGPTP